MSDIPVSEQLSDYEFRLVFMRTGIPQRIIDNIEVTPKDWHEYANAVAKFVIERLRTAQPKGESGVTCRNCSMTELACAESTKPPRNALACCPECDHRPAVATSSGERELKPCPFCPGGGDPGTRAVGGMTFIQCTACSATGPSFKKSFKNAIAAWNLRSASAARDERMSPVEGVELPPDNRPYIERARQRFNELCDTRKNYHPSVDDCFTIAVSGAFADYWNSKCLPLIRPAPPAKASGAFEGVTEAERNNNLLLSHMRTALAEGTESGMCWITAPVCESVIEALASRLTRGYAAGWQPIETAPRDGRGLLMCRAGAGRKSFVGWFSRPSNVWVDGNGSERDPTHWQPLPPAPYVSAESEGAGS